MNKSVAELLSLRFQFEQLTENFNMPRHESDIDILKWYVEEGYKSNSLRDGFDDALKIAKQIVGELDGPSKET
jgi:hypothetical protein